MLVYLILGVVLILILVTCIPRKGVEHYGQMKKIGKIPFTDCQRICGQYYRKCLQDDIHNVNAGWCERRFGDGCVMECYYSNYHRMN